MNYLLEVYGEKTAGRRSSSHFTAGKAPFARTSYTSRVTGNGNVLEVGSPDRVRRVVGRKAPRNLWATAIARLD